MIPARIHQKFCQPAPVSSTQTERSHAQKSAPTKGPMPDVMRPNKPCACPRMEGSTRRSRYTWAVTK